VGSDKTSNTKISPMSLSGDKLGALADICELLAISFSFPSSELTEAISSGNFQADLIACLEELGVSLDPELLSRMTQGETSPQSAQGLHESMRKEYSRLYLSPGTLAIIYPYEGAFRYVAGGGKGSPTLFINPTALDVERYMRRADALPDNANTEPVDSIFSELDFLRLLYTTALINASSEISRGDELSRQWLEFAEEFRVQHIDTWLEQFMRETIRLSRIEVYRWLAETALAVFDTLD
jgi:TorA maturation chaperone TorD